MYAIIYFTIIFQTIKTYVREFNENHRGTGYDHCRRRVFLFSKEKKKKKKSTVNHEKLEEKYTSYAACPSSTSKKYFHKVYLDFHCARVVH